MDPITLHFQDYPDGNNLTVSIYPPHWNSIYGEWSADGLLATGIAGQGYYQYKLFPPSLWRETRVREPYWFWINVRSTGQSRYFWSLSSGGVPITEKPSPMGVRIPLMPGDTGTFIILGIEPQQVKSSGYKVELSLEAA